MSSRKQGVPLHIHQPIIRNRIPSNSLSKSFDVSSSEDSSDSNPDCDDICFEDYMANTYSDPKYFMDAQFLLKIAPLLRRGFKLIDMAVLLDMEVSDVEGVLDRYPDCAVKVLNQGS